MSSSHPSNLLRSSPPLSCALTTDLREEGGDNRRVWPFSWSPALRRLGQVLRSFVDPPEPLGGEFCHSQASQLVTSYPRCFLPTLRFVFRGPPSTPLLIRYHRPHTLAETKIMEALERAAVALLRRDDAPFDPNDPTQELLKLLQNPFTQKVLCPTHLPLPPPPRLFILGKVLAGSDWTILSSSPSPRYGLP